MAEGQHFYQAIGELHAALVVAADGTRVLDTQECHYPVFIFDKVQKKYQEKHQGERVFWRVYPHFKQQRLAFDVVTFVQQPQLGDGQFILQGDWVQAGQLNIWRNAQAGKINAYNWRPRLLPISWSNAPLPDGTFWQLKAQLVDGTLKIIEAAGPFPHPQRLEKFPTFRHQKQEQGQPQQQLQAPQKPAITSETIDWEDITPVSGKLELTIKINALPQVKLADGRCHFKVNCDGRVFQVSVKPKLWAKLETASTSYAQWIAAIAGKLGAATTDGFVLESPNIQVFERKQSKQVELPLESEVAQVQASATEQPLVISKSKAATETAKTPQAKTQAGEAATAESVPSPEKKPDPLAQPSTPKSEPKPKKIGKFNVEIR